MSVKQWMKGKIRTLILMSKEKEMIPIPKIIHDNRLLKGKNALITGGSSGIGAAMAQTFVNCGANVVIAGTNEEHLKSTLGKISGGTYVQFTGMCVM